MKICHVTSVHSTRDERIYFEECTTLKNIGYEVHIIGPGSSFISEGIHIHGYGDKPTSLKGRFWKLKKILLDICKEVDADIYHLHDPELLPLVSPMVKLGKKVIFDSHEDYPKTLLAREWIPAYLRRIVSTIYTQYEKRVCKKLAGFIACYHWTKDRVEKWCENTELVFNFPSKKTIDDSRIYAPENYVAYAGGISAQWMHHNIIEALSKCDDIYYKIAGSIDDDYGKGLIQKDGWEKVIYVGEVDHTKVYDEVYQGAIAGMALLDYIPQCLGHKGNLSNTKLFEYMAYGLPIICTDFDLWKEVIEGYECGICVNPHDIPSIVEAILYIANNPIAAVEMGRKGKQAILERYNWENTSKELIKVYSRIT